MKFIWEPKDIKSGRKIRKKIDQNKWEEKMIGFDAGMRNQTTDNCLIDLTSGAVAMNGSSLEEIAAYLNSVGFEPVSL